MRITALRLGPFQTSEPYPSLAVTRVGSSSPCSLRSRTTDLNEPIPIAVVARQSRRLEHEHDPDLTQAHFGCQALESAAVCGAAAGAALVLVDDLHSSGRPAQLNGAVSKMILPLRAFPVFDHLQGGRLPHVNKSDPLAMCVLIFFAVIISSLWRGCGADARPAR